MIEFRWMLDFLGVSVELWLLDFFFCKILGARKYGKTVIGIIYFFAGILLFALSISPIKATQRTCGSFFVYLLFIFLFQGNIILKLLIILSFILVNIGAELLCWAILSILSGDYPASIHYHELVNYIQGIIFSKIIACAIIYLITLLIKMIQNKQTTRQIMIYLLIILMITGAIYQLAEASAVTNNRLLRIDFVITTFLLILSSIMLFYLLDRHMEAEQIRQQAAMDQMKETMQKKFYQVSIEREAQMRGLRHDLQNHLAVVQSHLQRHELAQACDYINGLGIEAEKSRIIVTGAANVDAILNIKKEAIEEAQIFFQYELPQPFLLHIEEMDLVVLLANSLDNALDAVEKCKENNQRWIRLVLHTEEKYTLLQVSNMAPVSIHYDHTGYPQTNKADQALHGLGLKNIKRIVNKYQGTKDFFEDEGQFILRLMLPHHSI